MEAIDPSAIHVPILFDFPPWPSGPPREAPEAGTGASSTAAAFGSAFLRAPEPSGSPRGVGGFDTAGILAELRATRAETERLSAYIQTQQKRDFARAVVDRRVGS